MPNDTIDDSAGIWERLWRTGALHSCNRGYRGNYEGPIAAFWSRCFDELPDGALVVDVGTGNGAVPLLAKAAALRRGLEWRIHGTDLAAVDPVSSVPSAREEFVGIEFHSRVPIESLPFPDGSVDLLTSQYAFEYAQRDAALAEVARVTRGGGSVAMVLHARDSLVYRTSIEQIQLCAALFEDIHLFEHARTMVGHLAAATTPQQRALLGRSPVVEADRESFNAAVSTLMARIRSARVPQILARAGESVRVALGSAGHVPVAEVFDRLDREAAELRDEWGRLRAFESAAMDEDALADLVARFRQSGYTVTTGVLVHEGEGSMGWTLEAAGG